MLTIASLFGRSPFSPLKSHMEKVSLCVYQLRNLFDALKEKNFKKLEEIAKKIGELEHEADKTKNEIRNHLPKSLFLALDRGSLLEILSLQDHIADKAEDVAVLLCLKPLEILPVFEQEFTEFFEKNMEAFNGAFSIIKELHELLESSFGGIEAKKVCLMADQVAFKEHEVDLIQRKLFKRFLLAQEEMDYATFFLWQKLLESVGDISNLSENLADRIRMTLELK